MKSNVPRFIDRGILAWSSNDRQFMVTMLSAASLQTCGMPPTFHKDAPHRLCGCGKEVPTAGPRLDKINQQTSYRTWLALTVTRSVSEGRNSPFLAEASGYYASVANVSFSTASSVFLLIQLAGEAAVAECRGLVEAANRVLATLLKLLGLVVVKVRELDNGWSQQEQKHRRHKA